MTIKILFFDTSALIKMFVQEIGSEKIKWITSPETRVRNSLSLVINDQVCIEFEKNIFRFAINGKISKEKCNLIISQFNRVYKNKYFRVIGQNIISKNKKELSISDINKEFNLRIGVNDWDGYIYQSIVNNLAWVGGESHPILVTCDSKFANKVRNKGYRTINPIKNSFEEIEAILNFWPYNKMQKETHEFF